MSTINGGSGDETFTGTIGDDSLSGGGGNDTIDAYSGNDTLSGDEGDDSILGRGGQDFITGGDGADTLDGGIDADTIIGGAGNDVLIGGTDNDTMDGGIGDDTLAGGYGNDTLQGGDGSDTLRGDWGNDSIMGGNDADTFQIKSVDGRDTLEGGEGGIDSDTLEFTDSDPVVVTFSGNEMGDYTVNGGSTNGTFTQIEGVRGGAGDDSIDAAASGSNQTLDGGAGSDTIIGGTAGDDIAGGDGDDNLTGGQGNDRLTGGDGNDTFTYAPGDGDDTITDFNTGNTGPVGDGDLTNNDFVDLSGFYDNLSELRADFDDDGVLNQSNATNTLGESVDYSDNSQFSGGSLTFDGATRTSFSDDNTGVVCFVEGTLIETPAGQRPIESLRLGEAVTTMDNGVQSIVWIGRRDLGPSDLRANPRLWPILIPVGALGARRPLLVSRQHGILLDQDRFVRAGHLAKASGPARIVFNAKHVRYFHLMFESHQVIFANGQPAESFYPGPVGLQTLTREMREEFHRSHGGLHAPEAVRDWYGPPVRPFLTKSELRASFEFAA